MADRFGENYIDQDDIGYAGAKIAMKRYDVLCEKANCFFFLLVLLFWLTSNCIATCFCFLIFFISPCIYKLKSVPQALKSLLLLLAFYIYIFFIRYYDACSSLHLQQLWKRN